MIHTLREGIFNKLLETVLKTLQKSTVIICGTLTNYCCGTTARQAYERGFQVIFGADVTATDDPDMQDAELRVIRKGFGRVMTSEEINPRRWGHVFDSR